jgi:hypothetical protein
MSTVNENQDHRERSWLYITCWVVLIALVVGGLIAFRSATETKNANDKADQLITELKAASARTPDKDQIVRVLGDDGGATCADPNDALSRSILLSQLTNGATGPGARPVIADSRVFKGQLLIIKIYCPDELDDFQAYVDNLKTDDVASD